LIPIETGRNDYRPRAHASGVSHRHRTADAIRANFVAGCQKHPASLGGPTSNGLPRRTGSSSCSIAAFAIRMRRSATQPPSVEKPRPKTQHSGWAVRRSRRRSGSALIFGAGHCGLASRFTSLACSRGLATRRTSFSSHRGLLAGCECNLRFGFHDLPLSSQWQEVSC
jgi:hypothetical protein